MEGYVTFRDGGWAIAHKRKLEKCESCLPGYYNEPRKSLTELRNRPLKKLKVRSDPIQMYEPWLFLQRRILLLTSGYEDPPPWNKVEVDELDDSHVEGNGSSSSATETEGSPHSDECCNVTRPLKRCWWNTIPWPLNTVQNITCDIDISTAVVVAIGLFPIMLYILANY